MKCIFIYNPVGGKGSIAKKKEYIVQELKEKYDEVDVQATACAGDMTRIAREAVGKYDAIIFAGGDGSFNELLQGIADFDERPVLGYIPSGTVNDVAHSLRIPSKIKKALQVIKTGKVEEIDCMRINDRYSIYVATTGAFTSATYNTSQSNKNHIGRIAYGVEAALHNLKFRVFALTCKGEKESFSTENCIMVTFINSRYIAGFKMNKRADLQDGELEVAIIEQKKKHNIFHKIGSLASIAGLFFLGYRAKVRRITHLKGKSFDVELPEDMTWNIDGEKGFSGNAHIEIVPKKVRILVPNK